ncbi:MAG: M1 family metallopeptidase [Planctomycetes bacterium]|nr:M1 family metallopeptidase [Planctomycetota bacterium]
MPKFLLAASCALAALCPAQSPDALHYQLELDLDFQNSVINGVTTATFASQSPALTTLSLDLDSGLTVTSVTMNGNSRPFARPTHRLDITLDQPYDVGQTFTVRIVYGGPPPAPSGFGGMHFDTTSGGRPLAWTLSEPWDARTWWPGKDQLDDKATFAIWISHPDTMQAASNGVFDGTDVLPGGRARSRWHTSYPMAAYLASFVCTEWSRRTDTYTGFGAAMPVEFFVFPESFSSWQAGMDRVVPMLNAFSGAYGQYPFVDEKYGIAQFPWSGGMEHQTLTSQSSVSESLTAHELAHQWWGDMVTCQTWSDIWLNEGFATFSEALWYERKAGGTLADYRSAMISRKPQSTTGTVYVYNPISTSAIFSTTNVYRKGAWALHMLRGVLGDPAFFAALQAYRTAYEGDSATTAEFRAVVEQSSGQDLGWFFDQWVMNGGSPAYTSAWRSVVRGGSHFLLLRITQSQSSQPVFTMPVRVRVTTGAGTIDAVVWNDERTDEVVVPLPAAATAVAIDPEQWILRGTPTSGAYSTPFFGATNHEVFTAPGGSVEYHLDLGAGNGGRPYGVLMSLSGTTPATVINGLSIPIAADAFTFLALDLGNTPLFADFFGTLDATGGMRAVMNVPPGIASVLAGFSITAAAVMVDTFDYASRPVAVRLR